MSMFPAPQAIAQLYQGEVMHMRLKPKTHRFHYRVFSMLVDLGQLEAASKLSRLFSVDRFNLLSFHQKDHGLRDGSSVDAFMRKTLSEQGVELEGGRILLSCTPRVLGYVFNPLCIYFAYHAQGHLAALVYEVRNTFGEMHLYVAPVEQGQMDESGIKQERDKIFHVSPFLDMKLRYFFRILPPGETLRIRILEKDEEGPILSATYHAKALALNSIHILRLCTALPFVTLKIILSIHWEALRLWLKGIGIRRWTPPPPLVSRQDI